MAHGAADPVIASALGAASRAELERLGHTVDWHVYPMAHQVCAAEIADLRGWLGARFR
jgi:phospholipase/carboxylesterase